MSVIELDPLSDQALKILVSEVFNPRPETIRLDRAVRESLLKEQRTRAASAGSSAPALFSDPLVTLIWIPEMRLVEFVTAGSSLVQRIIALDRAAVGAFVSGNRSVYEDLICCVNFVVKISTQLAEDLCLELARERRRVH